MQCMDRTALEKMLGEGLSLAEIGRRVDRHESTVSYWMTHFGLHANGAERHAAKGALSSKDCRRSWTQGCQRRRSRRHSNGARRRSAIGSASMASRRTLGCADKRLGTESVSSHLSARGMAKRHSCYEAKAATDARSVARRRFRDVAARSSAFWSKRLGEHVACAGTAAASPRSSFITWCPRTSGSRSAIEALPGRWSERVQRRESALFCARTATRRSSQA
jgi:hypothetical protein